MTLIIVAGIAAAALYGARRWKSLRAENTELKAQLHLLKRRLARR